MCRSTVNISSFQEIRKTCTSGLPAKAENFDILVNLSVVLDIGQFGKWGSPSLALSLFFSLSLSLSSPACVPPSLPERYHLQIEVYPPTKFGANLDVYAVPPEHILLTWTSQHAHCFNPRSNRRTIKVPHHSIAPCCLSNKERNS